MMKPLLALLALALVAAAPAQTTPGGPRSDAVMLNIKKLDALIQIVPLALTKEQLPPILAAIEKVRQKEKELRLEEDKILATLDAKVSKVVEEGVGKDVYPPREVQMEVAKKMLLMGGARQQFVEDMTDLVYAACKTTLNEGQLKTMEKSLKPELLGSAVKGAEMDETAKIKFFIRKVILDPIAYDILVEMSRKKREAGR